MFEATEEDGIEPFPVLMYVAFPTPDTNPLWLGDGPIEDIAHQVLTRQTPTGGHITGDQLPILFPTGCS